MNNKLTAFLGVAGVVLAGCLLLTPGVARGQAVPGDAALLPVSVGAGDAGVRYLGRWDTRDGAGPRCAWSASEVEVRFIGTRMNVVLGDTSDGDAMQVVVDGQPTSVLTLHSGRGVYPVFAEAQSAGVHTVELVKRTEAFVGTVQVLGFQISAGGKLAALAAAPSRRLEIIGDSITCGYGDEAKDQNEHFSPATENAYLSYGAVAARALGADYHCVAWSGRKMSPDNTMPSIYGLVLPTDPSSAWDFGSWTPDAVVINLGTNDFNPVDPPRAAWVQAYEQFLETVVRAHYPKATIYVAIGPMMNDNWPPGQSALTTIKSYLTQIVADETKRGDTRIHTLFFTPQDASNGLGADYHPSVKTQGIMAGELEAAVRENLGW